MVEQLGLAIASAQRALDLNAAEIAQMLADPEQGIALGEDGRNMSLLELGFEPTFYHITEATIDAKVAFSASESTGFSVGAKVGVNVGFFAASVNASYSAKYSFDVNGSSAISAKLVSIPAPSILNERLRALTPSQE